MHGIIKSLTAPFIYLLMVITAFHCLDSRSQALVSVGSLKGQLLRSVMMADFLHYPKKKKTHCINMLATNTWPTGFLFIQISYLFKTALFK